MNNLQTHHLNINDPNFIENPYTELASLRDNLPVFYDHKFDKVFIMRYADVAAMLKDKRLGRTMLHLYSREEIGWPPPDPRQAPFRRFQDNVFMDKEGAAHTRIRTLVSKVFTPRRVESLRGVLEKTTHNLIDAVEAQGECDFVRDIAEPLPVAMISDLLGIPEELRGNLRPWSNAIVKMYELGYTDQQVHEANKAATDFMEMMGELAEVRRKKPQDDLLSDLVRVENEGDKLNEDELRATCIFLLNAGHEATVNGSSLGLRALFQNPAQLELMKQAVNENNSVLLKTAVDELLRFETPLPMFERYILEDMDFSGVHLERGMELALMYISGNHDPRRFERPDDLDITRTENPHLTFGLGTHYCLGAPLARLELQSLFSVLFKRVPNLRPNGPAQFGQGFVIRGLTQLPIAF